MCHVRKTKSPVVFLLRLFLLWIILAVVPPPSAAYAKTGVRDLDTPAISVKAPGRVTLIAITNAGQRLVAVGEHGVIAYSDDNGKTWAQAKVPVDVTLTAVAFANASNGWAVGHYGVILNTRDGGLTWNLQLNGIEANQLTLAAAQAVSSVANPTPEQVLAIKRANFFVADGPDKPFLSILVNSPQDVTVFGAYRMVFNTTDGGKSWSDWNLHVQDGLSHNLYDAADIGGDIYITSEMGMVFRSTDTGMTFTNVASPGPATLLTVLPTGDGGVFVCGVAGYAFRSEDGGSSWQKVDMHTDSNLTGGVVLKSGEILVASQAGNFYVSTDHAQTFSALPLVEPMALYDVTQDKNGDIVAVGDLGAVVIAQSNLLNASPGV